MRMVYTILSQAIGSVLIYPQIRWFCQHLVIHSLNRKYGEQKCHQRLSILFGNFWLSRWLQGRIYKEDMSCSIQSVNVVAMMLKQNFIFFYAKMVWRGSRIANTVLNSSIATLEERLEACFACCFAGMTHLQELPFWILWRLWKIRNHLIFQQKQMHWKTLIQLAKSDAMEWTNNTCDVSECNNFRIFSPYIRSGHKFWRKPPEGWIKCNVDGSFLRNTIESRVDWIIRNDAGGYMGAVQCVGRRVQSPLESKMHAILMTLQYCWGKGYKKVIIESDCKKAIDIIQNRVLHFGIYNWTREIHWWQTKMDDSKMQWIPRETNRVADKLAKEHSRSSFIYHFYVPMFITTLLHSNHVHSS